MALEYDWSGDTAIDTPALRSFIATATGGQPAPDGTIFLNGMYVMANLDSEDDANEAMRLFGFEDRFWVTFRFANLADETTKTHNTALMVHVLIAFAQSHSGSGVLLHNGERAVLQYGKDGLIFDADWEDWTENPEVAPLLTQFASRTLPQPLL
ncbi:hypothetical protein HH310_27040 [Actinoplanes sp. TBRC 11911]|uniref:SitI3 family protein n=1 Tax=Actinoplanes sp. TBRC 11911 TaxID=2729386 RepID=UPI00145F826F|nr:SitI3 family protein [Actinoplanes sp. TBRC 11911]NMO54827.1 hypothetical protein [Actinoplanes sp. TBRC 11911]